MSFEPQSPDWYRALTLSERIEALQGHAPADSATSEACIHERLERWHAEFGHALDDYLSVCAALHGLSRNDLASLLGAPIEAVRGRVAVPPWLRSLESAFRAADSGSPNSVRGDPGRRRHHGVPESDRAVAAPGAPAIARRR